MPSDSDHEYVDRYNNHRLHSLLDNLTPEQYQQAYYSQPAGSPTGDAANKKTASTRARLEDPG